jgi:glutathione-specific gamma-glutamylcyclotransferase
VPVTLAGGSRVTALAYVVDRRHGQYAGRLEAGSLLDVVRHGVGRSGNNPDYIRATHEHLVALGLEDRTLAWLAANLR